MQISAPPSLRGSPDVSAAGAGSLRGASGVGAFGAVSWVCWSAEVAAAGPAASGSVEDSESVSASSSASGNASIGTLAVAGVTDPPALGASMMLAADPPPRRPRRRRRFAAALTRPLCWHAFARASRRARAGRRLSRSCLRGDGRRMRRRCLCWSLVVPVRLAVVALRLAIFPLRLPLLLHCGGGRALNSHIFGRGPVDDGAFEGARPALVELEPAGHRLETHLQVLHLDPHPRRFYDEVVDQLVVQLIHRATPRLALRLALRVHGVQARLDIERLNQRFGLKSSFSNGPSSLRIQRIGARCDSKSVDSSNAKLGSSGGSYSGCTFRNWSSRIGADAAGIQEPFELHRRQIVNLLFRCSRRPRFSRMRARICSMICSTFTESERMLKSGINSCQLSAVSLQRELQRTPG